MTKKKPIKKRKSIRKAVKKKRRRKISKKKVKRTVADPVGLGATVDKAFPKVVAKPRKKRPAKRPPPKRVAKLKSPRSKTAIEMPGPDVVLQPGIAPGGTRGQLAYLRAWAGEVYATDPVRPSIDALHERKPFNTVGLSTFRSWARADQWVDKRQLFHERVLDGVRKRIGNDLIQSQVRMLRDGAEVYETLRDKILGGSGQKVPEAKSFEGLVNSFSRLSTTLTHMQGEVIDVIVPPVQTGDSSEAVEVRVLPELTREEARVAALAIVQQRRQLRAKKVDPPTGNNDDEDED